MASAASTRASAHSSWGFPSCAKDISVTPWPTCQSQHTTVAAAMRQAFLQADAKTASVGRLNKRVKRQAAGRRHRHLSERGEYHSHKRRRASRAKCERLLQHRYMQIEGMAELTPPLIGQLLGFRAQRPVGTCSPDRGRIRRSRATESRSRCDSGGHRGASGRACSGARAFVPTIRVRLR